MDSRSFTTKEEAEKMRVLFGPMGFGAVVFIPKYALDVPTPSFDETHLMHMLQFGNGFISNCGLLLNNITQRGSEQAAKDSLKAEMVERHLMTAWWA